MKLKQPNQKKGEVLDVQVILAVRQFLHENLGKEFIDIKEDLQNLDDNQIVQKLEKWKESISHKKHIIWEEITHSYFRIRYQF